MGHLCTGSSGGMAEALYITQPCSLLYQDMTLVHAIFSMSAWFSTAAGEVQQRTHTFQPDCARLHRAVLEIHSRRSCCMAMMV